MRDIGRLSQWVSEQLYWQTKVEGHCTEIVTFLFTTYRSYFYITYQRHRVAGIRRMQVADFRLAVFVFWLIMMMISAVQLLFVQHEDWKWSHAVLHLRFKRIFLQLWSLEMWWPTYKLLGVRTNFIYYYSNWYFKQNC